MCTTDPSIEQAVNKYSFFKKNLFFLALQLKVEEDSRVGPSQVNKEKEPSPILVLSISPSPLPPTLLRNWLWKLVLSQERWADEEKQLPILLPTIPDVKDSWEERICRRMWLHLALCFSAFLFHACFSNHCRKMFFSVYKTFILKVSILRFRYGFL